MHATVDPSIVRIDGPWVHRDVHANGIKLHVAEAGAGPLILLLHGFGTFWWAWRHQLTALSHAGFRVVAADLRGYGDSDKPPRGYDAWTLAGDVSGLIKALGERQAHIVGHGWGGLLAWTTAAMHPRVVRSITAIAAPHPLALRQQIWRTVLRNRSANQGRAVGFLFRAQWPMYPEHRLTAADAKGWETLVRQWAGSAWQQTEDFHTALQQYRQAMLIPGAAHSALEYYRWAFRAQLRGEGRRFSAALDRPISTPVLQIHGSQDPLLLLATAQASAPWLTGPNAWLVLPGVGHFPHEEAAEKVSRFIKDFVTKQR